MNAKLMSRIERKESGLILVYGRPGHGKTRYISKLMLEIAEQNKEIAFVSLAMDRENWLIKMNILPDDKRLKKIDFYDDPTKIGSVHQISQLFESKEYDLIVIDYLELLNFASKEIEAALHELYEAIQKWQCPVIAVSQTPHKFDEKLARPEYFEERGAARTRFNFILIDIKFEGTKMTSKTIGTHRTVIDEDLIKKLRAR